MKDIENTVDYIVGQRAMFGNVSHFYLFCKRAFDIMASLTAIIILLPLFIITSIIIKLDSPGPIFFNQWRIGFRGKFFNMHKFRSMVVDAEDRLKNLEDKNEVSGNMFKIKNDPRVTRVGKVLRRTSIDELPQLFNVIRGEMSIVGPRPPIGREVQKYDAWHNLRLSVKPGITGLWQISGRSNIGFEDMCRLDLKYIRERGFMYDFKIILKTVPVLFGDSRAF